MIRQLSAAILMVSAMPATAQMIDMPAAGTVTEVADRLAAAAEGAGATVFARVPHSKGAMSVGMELPDAELVIFGNPALGTPALQQDIRAGLALPLRVLVHDQDGQTVITYEGVDTLFDGLDIPPDAEVRLKVAMALGKLTTAAATGQ